MQYIAIYIACVSSFFAPTEEVQVVRSTLQGRTDDRQIQNVEFSGRVGQAESNVFLTTKEMKVFVIKVRKGPTPLADRVD